MKGKDRFIPLISLLLLGLSWEIISDLNLAPSFLFPSLTKTLWKMFQLLQTGELVKDFIKSLVRVLIGFTLGSAVGVVVGILVGLNETLYKFLNPIFTLFYAIPALGWAPIFMIWIGLGDTLPISLIFICSFFPLLYNTVTGIRSVSKDLIEAARTLGASPLQVLTTIMLPQAALNIFTGLRLEAGMAWRVVIAAEMIAVPTGVGALAIKAESLLQVDTIFVCLMVLALTCFLFDKGFEFLEHKTQRWREID